MVEYVLAIPYEVRDPEQTEGIGRIVGALNLRWRSTMRDLFLIKHEEVKLNPLERSKCRNCVRYGHNIPT